MAKATKKPLKASAKKMATKKPAAKKTVTKKPGVSAKSKPAKKMVAKPSAKTKSPATKQATKTKTAAPAPTQGSNVLWKFLEQKNARRKEQEENAKQNRQGGSFQQEAPRHQGFARFAGPRRRAA